MDARERHSDRALFVFVVAGELGALDEREQRELVSIDCDRRAAIARRNRGARGDPGGLDHRRDREPALEFAGRSRSDRLRNPAARASADDPGLRVHAATVSDKARLGESPVALE